MKLKNVTLLSVPLVLVAGALTLGGVLEKPVPRVIQGEVAATEVSVASKIPGRVARIAVHEGQRVASGDLVATLESPELTARLAQAEATARAAEAQWQKARRGTRSERIRAAHNQWQTARANAELAGKTFARVDRLFDDGVLPAQKRDEAQAGKKAAHETAAGARAAYDMAVAGSRQEDRAAAKAMLTKARGAVSEVHAYLKETELHAPIAGEITLKVVEAGEMISAGFPLVKIVDLNDVWVVLHLREDLLPGIGMGTRLAARFPALGDRVVSLKVDYIAPMGDFATWRATRATGDFDLKTFEVRARPETPVVGLRPGMSAIVPLGETQRPAAASLGA
jgi:HlyD family secretion protein